MTAAQLSHVTGPFRPKRVRRPPTPTGWVLLAIIVVVAVTAVTYFRDRGPARVAPAVTRGGL